jgi:hypothetical protein
MAGSAPALAGYDAAERLRFLQDGMRVAARKARTWTWSWFAIYGALTAGQLVESAVVASPQREGAWVTAGASAVGVLSVVVSPLRVIGDSKRLDQRLAARTTADDPCTLVEEAEKMLLRDAKSEVFGKSWLVHLGGIAINTAVGLALSLWLHDYRTAALNVTVGEALAQLQINTQPTGATDLLARYRSGDLGRSPGRTAASPVGWMIAPSLSRDRLGVQAVVVF